MTYTPNTVILVNFLPSINSTYARRGSVYPSNAVLLIGSILKHRGFHVKVIDGGYYPDYMTMLMDYIDQRWNEILYVGMSVMTTQVPMALKTSRTLKEKYENIPIVWGGTHPTLFPAQTLMDRNIDIVAINEGASSAVKIAETLRDGGDLAGIAGIGYRKGDRDSIITDECESDDINALPVLDFSLIEVHNYTHSKKSSYEREFPRFKEKIKPIPILTGLGCPYKCQFCINVIMKRRYRVRDAKSIVSEIKKLQSTYGVNTFLFMDEDFFIDKRRVPDFLDLVEKENLHFNWRMWCRVDHFRPGGLCRDLIERLDRIGHGSLVMGGESGDQEILNSIQKGTTTEQILNSLKALAGTKINPRYSFIIGFENETLRQIKKTYRLCLAMQSIRKDVDIAGPFLLRLYPGSPIYGRIVERYEIKTPEDLQSWEAFLVKNEGRYSEMPWTPKAIQNNLTFIPFYSQQAMRLPQEISSIKGILRYLLTVLSRYRIRHFNFHLPFEYWIAKYVLRKL